MYYLSLTEQHIPASLAGVVAIIFRQTNVVWLVFVAGTTSVRHLQPLMPKQTSGTLSEILSFVKAFLVNFIVMFKVLFGYGAVAVGFAVFVVINDGVVVGDRSSHTACLNIPQLFYFITFTAAFSWPLLIDGIPQLLKNARNKMFFCGFVLTLFISELAVYKFTYVHKYLLADNRHYPFYVWRKLFARHWSVRYLLVPCYLVIGWLIRHKLSLQQSALWQLVYWICRQRDNGREWQRNQANHPVQTPHGGHTWGSSCGHVMLYEGAPSSNNPPSIQSHGHQASHGYKSQSQSYPHCSGRTGMHSQTATASGLPADHKEVFMPQYDNQPMDCTHSLTGEPAQFFTFGGTGVLYAGRAPSRPDRRDADLLRHNPRKYHGKALHGHSSYQQQGRLSRSSGRGASLLYSGAPSSDVPSCDSRLSKSNVGNYH
ncbi:Dol-P-Glc:Glc(2)Man(9)GlcNAc(2)-PP-Dol alpha-1,2-glucosyltransferase [Exaiptasia diaphana]|nr:Dol-P-Glc:Glc(2)Man(9)GlcNAc(2)-PP-Dol alpha-1,2-glucosyltransferase [Exaiptasia diaphana]